MKIDVDSLNAIDVHVHAERNHGEPQDEVTTGLLDAAAKYFGAEPIQPTAQEVADYYRERGILVAWCSPSTTRRAWGAGDWATTRCSKPPVPTPT